MAKPIDAKWLKGLVFRTSKTVEGTTGQVRMVPEERELTPDDVLDWKDTGPRIVIITADGRKLTVDKKTAAKAEKDTAGGAGGDTGTTGGNGFGDGKDKP
jgi:hypothetical protein